MPTKYNVTLPADVQLVSDMEIDMFCCHLDGNVFAATSERELVRYLRTRVDVCVEPYEFVNDSNRLPDSFHVMLSTNIALWATRVIGGATLYKLVLEVETDSDELDPYLWLEFESEAA